MLFEFYIRRERFEPAETRIPNGAPDGSDIVWPYTRHLTAYSESAYFQRLDNAMLYAAKHASEALTWEPIGDDYWEAKLGDAEFTIARKPDAQFEPHEPMAMPDKFNERQQQGD